MDEINYPDSTFKHIYDPERLELAVTILEKEFRKLFLGLPDAAWPAIIQSIRGWAEHPEDYHLSGEQLRDFWDSFAAVLESIKLKPAFTALVTAENARWRHASLSVRSLAVNHMMEQLRQIPGLHFQKYMPIEEVLEALTNNPAAAEEQKRISDQHSTDPKQDEYPIIVHRENEQYRIIDGNRRTLRAAFFGEESIDAWVVELDGTQPFNYWVPLNDLIQLVKVYKSASGDEAQSLQQAVARVLQFHFDASPLAEYMYKIRIGAYDEAAHRLHKLALAQ